MLVLTVLISLGVVLRAYQLDRALGGGDENEVLLSWVYTPIESIVTTWSLGSLGGHHVFHTIVLRIMVLLFGEENELAIRFPAFVAGIACLWFVYKIAKEIFISKVVAQFVLLAVVVCPIHIYYSQTARGYSFMMFFSTLSIYATLQILKTEKYFKWCLLLFLSGFLLVYTMPLAVIFILGLGLWILFVLSLPKLRADFFIDARLCRKKLYHFFGVFLSMGLCSVLSYFPLIGQMMGSSAEYYKTSKVYSSSWDTLINFVPNLFLKIFSGPLIYFIPFIFVGIFFDKTCARSYRLLPVTILLTSYIVSLVSGLAWYPRVYLFNLPLLLIFFVGGVLWFGKSLRGLINPSISFNWVGYSLMGLYATVSLVEIFSHYYPSIKTFNANVYKKNIKSQIKNNDLLLVADSRNYLYARSIYKKNLQNIIADNQLGGIKLLVENRLNIEDYKVRFHNQNLPVFYNWQGKVNFNIISEDRKLIYLDEINSTSLLTNDFEITADWKIHSGAGSFTPINDHHFTEKYSLLAKSSANNDMILQSSLGQIELEKPHLIVLVWSTKKFASRDKFFAPVLEVSTLVDGKKSYGQVPLAKANEGMALFIKEKSTAKEQYYWQVHSSIGWLPAGKLGLYMYLKCEAGKSIAYDSLRLFLVSESSQFKRRALNKAES
ncbi:MAG TPA: hypothetical protein EYF97_03510 [Gammaproteobacteria bacterium]|nr:hypothetical protein [Gammaproteobacteria bacterium]